MLTPSFTGQFKQDRKRARKRGYAGHWECNVEPDFLLIWYYSGDTDIVFVRAGSHSDLFG